MSEGNMRTSAVLRCIDSNPQITQEEYGHQPLGKSALTVKSPFVEKGIIIRKNGRRNGWWEINEIDKNI